MKIQTFKRSYDKYLCLHVLNTAPSKLLPLLVSDSGMILGLQPANERWRYFVTTSLIGWAQT